MSAVMDDHEHGEPGRTAIGNDARWSYLPVESDGDSLTITLVREGDGLELRFTVPSVVQQGGELEQIASLVIGAQDRADSLKGLGG
jgi:hypothetical protein